MTSPLSIGFCTMWRTSAAYSVGFPKRDGCGTCCPKDSLVASGRPAIMGVSKMPGAIVITRILVRANSLANGNVIDTTAPLDAA